MRSFNRFIFFILSGLLLIGPVGCAKDLITGKKTYNMYSIDSDVTLGSHVMKSQLTGLEKNKKSYDSGKNKKQLKNIQEMVNNIARVSHYPNFPYEVHLADVDIVNAWCAPGGKVMVYEGLWDPKKGLIKKGDKDELAAVLSHEIAHATARHVTESLSRNLTIATLGSIASTVISTQSTVGGNLFQEMFSEGFNIFVPTYSRKNELEADYIGIIYMSKAGYDPRAAIRVWERASKKKGDKSSIYASHPASGIRAKSLQKHLPEAMAYYEESQKGEKRRRKQSKIN